MRNLFEKRFRTSKNFQTKITIQVQRCFRDTALLFLRYL